jgi:hypothetical protein
MAKAMDFTVQVADSCDRCNYNRFNCQGLAFNRWGQSPRPLAVTAENAYFMGNYVIVDGSDYDLVFWPVVQ